MQDFPGGGGGGGGGFSLRKFLLNTSTFFETMPIIRKLRGTTFNV